MAAPRHAAALVLAAVLLVACVPGENLTTPGTGGSGGTAGGAPAMTWLMDFLGR